MAGEFKLLENLLITPSPTGYESAGQRIWVDYVKKYADEVITDTYGSAAALIKTNPDAINVMLESHCDEIGMVVQHIDDQGFIWAQRIGGSDPTIARARNVVIHTKSGLVSGIVGHLAIHLQEKDSIKPATWKDIFIDIGATSREEALGVVQIGDPITYSNDYDYLNEELISARALDNRVGGYIIAQVLKKLKASVKSLKVNVIGLNAVQEEIGGFGARMMSYRFHPDLAIVTDVTHATDIPGVNQREHGKIILGGGPVLMHGNASHPKLTDRISDVANGLGIQIQHEASSVRTGTDTDSIYHTKTGIASSLLSVPLRYMHSPVEVVSLTDVKNLIDVMVGTVLSFKQKDNFSIF